MATARNRSIAARPLNVVQRKIKRFEGFAADNQFTVWRYALRSRCAWNMHVRIKKCDCEHFILISTLNLEALNSLFRRQIPFFGARASMRSYGRFYFQRGCPMGMSKSIKNSEVDFSMLRHGKLVATFRTLGKFTLHEGWTAGASKGSAVRYVKGKAAFWAFQYILRLRIHPTPLSLNQPPSDVLKTFLETLKSLV